MSEPVKTKIRINYAVYTEVLSCAEAFETYNYRKGEGDKTEYDTRSLGWFIRFEGSQERLYFGETEPQFKVGDKVKITFEVIE